MQVFLILDSPFRTPHSTLAIAFRLNREQLSIFSARCQPPGARRVRFSFGAELLKAPVLCEAHFSAGATGPLCNAPGDGGEEQ